MPHTFNAWAFLLGRIVVGLVGALAFYMAFFLYEDQDGIWQDRIDGFWLTVYDRAKITENTTTALFNKIGDFLYRVFSRVFGTRLLSFHAVALSIDLSLLCLTTGKVVSLIIMIVDELRVKTAEPSDFHVYFGALLLALIGLPVTTAILIRMRLWWLHIVLIIECVYVLSSVDIWWMGIQYPMPIEAILLSLASDVLAVLIIRTVFSFIARSLSIARIVAAVCALMAVVILFAGMLAFAVVFGDIAVNEYGKKVAEFWGNVSILSGELLYLNLVTAIYCVIPVIMLLIVLIHRITWPVLSKLIYPLCRFKIVTNKKVLSSVGALCFTFAFDVAPVGIKDILKLFS